MNEQWGLHNTGQTGGTPDADIDAVEAWDITTGSSGVIVAVSQDKFGSLDEFKKRVARHKKGGSVALLVRRGENALYVPIEIGAA